MRHVIIVAPLDLASLVVAGATAPGVAPLGSFVRGQAGREDPGNADTQPRLSPSATRCWPCRRWSGRCTGEGTIGLGNTGLFARRRACWDAGLCRRSLAHQGHDIARAQTCSRARHYGEQALSR